MKQRSAARFLKTKSSFHSGLRYLLPGSSLSRTVNNLFIVAIMAVLAGTLTTAVCADAGEDTALQPPKITIKLSSSQQVADGFLFVAPKVAGISGGTSPGATGPEIVDNNGRPIWFLPVTNGQSPADFRVQYQLFPMHFGGPAASSHREGRSTEASKRGPPKQGSLEYHV